MLEYRSPQWSAFSREAAISGQSISAGLNALRKANYAAVGQYSHAFFSLSIGLERMLKLIFLIDYALANQMKFPNEAELRNRFGHDLEKLFRYASQVHNRLPNAPGRYPIPAAGIERDIVNFLSRFARHSRYYNLDYLTGAPSRLKDTDPISEWFTSIGEQIFSRHYSVKQRQKDALSAEIAERMLGDVASIRFTAEDGSALDSVRSASLQTGRNKVLQKFGTYYCARIARFLYMVLYDLVYDAHKNGLVVPHLYEFFFPFLNDDQYLLGRKTFPPRGQ